MEATPLQTRRRWLVASLVRGGLRSPPFAIKEALRSQPPFKMRHCCCKLTASSSWEETRSFLHLCDREGLWPPVCSFFKKNFDFFFKV